MTTRNVIDVIAIALLGAIIIIAAAQAQQDRLIKPTWNNGPPEPFYKPKPLTPEYLAWLRAKNLLPPEEFDREYKGELKVVRGASAAPRVLPRRLQSRLECTRLHQARLRRRDLYHLSPQRPGPAKYRPGS
jgi:hypothetical protein